LNQIRGNPARSTSRSTTTARAAREDHDFFRAAPLIKTVLKHESSPASAFVFVAAVHRQAEQGPAEVDPELMQPGFRADERHMFAVLSYYTSYSGAGGARVFVF